MFFTTSRHHHVTDLSSLIPATLTNLVRNEFLFQNNYEFLPAWPLERIWFPTSSFLTTTSSMQQMQPFSLVFKGGSELEFFFSKKKEKLIGDRS